MSEEQQPGRYVTYELYDRDGQGLYAGATTDPQARITRHQQRSWGHRIDHHATTTTSYQTLTEVNQAEQKLLSQRDWQHHLLDEYREEFTTTLTMRVHQLLMQYSAPEIHAELRRQSST